MARLLGIDIGTSGCKALLINECGDVLWRHTECYDLSLPRQGWAEQEPEDWWRAVETCLNSLPSVPDAIGLTGQMHGSVFLDESGQVIRPAILWNDQRTAQECQEITRLVGDERLLEITGNPALTGFQLPKILWLRANEPENYRRLRRVLLPKDYVRWRMIGKMATDVSDASGTSLLDVPRRCWSDEIFSRLQIDREILPEVFESAELTGTASTGSPVVAGAGDQAAAAVGCGAVDRSVVSLCLGTSGVVFRSLEQPLALPSRGAHMFCHANGLWHGMGVMLSCGGALAWAKNLLGEAYSSLEAAAATAPVGARGVTFLPYLAGERTPHADSSLTGSFTGLRIGSGKNDLVRALYEGVTFGLHDCLEALGAEAESLRITGGGARSDFWMQMIADVFRVPCYRMEVDEGPSLGAALLAGVGIGLWSSVKEACDAAVRIGSEFTPSNSRYGAALQAYGDASRRAINKDG